MMRPKSTARDLPPRMLRRTKRLKNGELWVAYYYNGRDELGNRKEIPLGTDLTEAKRKWAELECKPTPQEIGIMRPIFDRYIKEVMPTKAPRTQKDNLYIIGELRRVFDDAPIDAITPQHIAQYRDKRTAKVRANREISLLSHIFNLAREWGYTAKENPCKGVRKNKETPRDYYADDQVWKAVYAHASEELQDAMDIAYLTGQRPADVLKMRLTDISDGALSVRQNKTSKLLRILINDETGQRTELGRVIDKIQSRSKQVKSLYLVATDTGAPLNKWTLRVRFETACTTAADAATATGNDALAERIKQFQFRDIRAKAASEQDLESAQKLLGHTKSQITETVYRRVGETVKPTK